MASGSKKEAALSSRLLQMKFMQKASEKTKLEEAQRRAEVQQKDNSKEASQQGTSHSHEATGGLEASQRQQPSAQPAQHGCQIIYESAPLPAGLTAGRLRFGPKATQTGQPEGAATVATVPGPQGPGEQPEGGEQQAPQQRVSAPAQRQAGANVGDVEMAMALQPQKNKHRKKDKGKRTEPYNPYTSLRELKRAKK